MIKTYCFCCDYTNTGTNSSGSQGTNLEPKSEANGPPQKTPDSTPGAHQESRCVELVGLERKSRVENKHIDVTSCTSLQTLMRSPVPLCVAT